MRHKQKLSTCLPRNKNAGSDYYHAMFRVCCSLGNVSNAVYVGVHLRRSDLVRISGDYGAKYMLTAVRFMVDKFTDKCILFIICSDNPKSAREMFQSALVNATIKRKPVCQPTTATSTGHNPSQDLAIMTACNHSIITIGSYGWWGAYLAGGTTVYCSTYPGFNPKLLTDFNEYYPASWIGL